MVDKSFKGNKGTPFMKEGPALVILYFFRMRLISVPHKLTSSLPNEDIGQNLVNVATSPPPPHPRAAIAFILLINKWICPLLCLYCKIFLNLKVHTHGFSKGSVHKVHSSEGKCSSRGKFLEAKVQGCISNIPHKFHHNIHRIFLCCLQTD